VSAPGGLAVLALQLSTGKRKPGRAQRKVTPLQGLISWRSSHAGWQAWLYVKKPFQPCQNTQQEGIHSKSGACHKQAKGRQHVSGKKGNYKGAIKCRMEPEGKMQNAEPTRTSHDIKHNDFDRKTTGETCDSGPGGRSSCDPFTQT